jgi:hypothetical protein
MSELQFNNLPKLTKPEAFIIQETKDSNCSFSIPFPEYLNLIQNITTKNPQLIKDFIKEAPSFMKEIVFDSLKRDPKLFKEFFYKNSDLVKDILVNNPFFASDLLLSFPQIIENIPELKLIFNQNRISGL